MYGGQQLQKVLRTVGREEDGLWCCWLTVDNWNYWRLGCGVECLGLHVSLFCVWGPRVLRRDQSARYFSDNWRERLVFGSSTIDSSTRDS